MGSKLCSRFRKFKNKVFSKKEKYDRLGEPEKEDLPPDPTVPAGFLGGKEPVVKQQPSNKSSNKQVGENQELQTYEEIGSWIATMEEQLRNISSICSERKNEEKEELCNSLGAAYYRICNFQMSKKYYEMYFRSIAKDGSLELVLLQRAHCNLGCVYRRLGDFEQAEEHLKKGLDISEELQDKRSKGRLLNNLGNICEMKKDFDGAIYYHAQRRKVAETLGDWESEAKACASLGSAHQIVGNLRASIVFYERVVIWLKRKYLFEQRQEKRQSIVSSCAIEDEEWV